MRFIREYSFYDDISSKRSEIYIDEYATIWSISARRLGEALCYAQDWRYSKKEYKTVHEALEQFISDANNRFNKRK